MQKDTATRGDGRMRLGLHYHTPAMQRDGAIWIPGYFGLFIDSLAGHCEKLVCFFNSPTEGELEQMDYCVKSPNVQMVDLGPHITIPLRTLRAIPKIPSLRAWQSELDILLIRAPTPLLPLFFRVWRKPAALLLVSDELAGIENLPQPVWRKKLIRWWGQWNHAQQMKWAQQSLVMVNSQVLYEQYKTSVPSLIQTQTTTLSKQDFYYREDTCVSPPYRLLYSGRITRIKGLFEIVQALSNLAHDGWDATLDLVGMLDSGDLVLEELLQFARSLGIGERVQYHGYKTAGMELLAYYRQADVYVIASQSSNEGFPRTIWEAMASSTPVVATRVGSIQSFAGDAAVLAPPKDATALTSAIKTVLTDGQLRKTLIVKGMELAQRNTLDKRAGEMMGLLQDHLSRSTL